MSTYGKPVTVTVPAATVTVIPVNQPTNIPLEPLSKPTYLLSHEYKIEDIEGQCVREWFKNDFGANNTFEFQAKLKSSAGRAKAKIVLDPKDKHTIKICEDLEIQANIDYGVSGLFKVRPKEVSAQFDFGLRPLSKNWFNPYVVFRLPRDGGVCKTTGTFGLGGVFHFDNWFSRRARHQFELGLGFGAAEGTKNDILLRQNFSLWYNNFIAGLYLGWNFTHGFKTDTKLAAAYSEGPARAYAQVDINDKFRFSNIGFGVSYKVRPDIKLFLQTQTPLGVKSTTTAEGASIAKIVDVGAGVEYQPIAGLGLKLGYFHDKKIATALSFNLNRYFSASLLFDVGLY